jgi:hypothetical protein
MALLFRLLLGIPMFVMLCALAALGVSFTVHSDTLGQRFTWAGLTAFFGLLAFAIWRILLFRRAEAASPQPAVGGASAGTGGVGGGPSSRTPDAGKPSPLIPSQTHHLAAASELPPSDKTQSLPHDLHEG